MIYLEAQSREKFQFPMKMTGYFQTTCQNLKMTGKVKLMHFDRLEIEKINIYDLRLYNISCYGAKIIDILVT